MPTDDEIRARLNAWRPTMEEYDKIKKEIEKYVDPSRRSGALRAVRRELLRKDEESDV